jgi:hypothetical protein
LGALPGATDWLPGGSGGLVARRSGRISTERHGVRPTPGQTSGIATRRFRRAAITESFGMGSGIRLVSAIQLESPADSHYHPTTDETHPVWVADFVEMGEIFTVESFRRRCSERKEDRGSVGTCGLRDPSRYSLAVRA